MKKTLYIIASAALALALLSSCAKEEFKENAIPAGEKIEVSLNGLIGEFTPADATKATAESVVRVTWGSGDKVYVYDGGNASIGTLTVTPDNNNASYAMLSGTITASSASPSKLTLVYVKGATEAPTIAGGKISVDLSSQNQTEVPFVLYTTVDYNAAALTKTNEYISFDFATSVMTVNCTGLQTGASGAVAGIDRAEIDGVSTACELTIDGSGVTAVAGTTPGTITRTEITGTGTSVFQQSDSRGSFRLAIAADPAAPTARNILVFQGTKVSGASFTPTTLAGGKSYNTVYQMGEYVAPPAGMLSGEFTVSDPDGSPNSGDETKVHFSKGNLYYDGAYKFEANQYDRPYYVNYEHQGHFFWSKDASVATTFSYYDTTSGDDIFFTNASATTANPDFTVNGEKGKYRTLSKNEWLYLFNERSVNGGTGEGKSYSLGIQYVDCKGLVLYPDNYIGTVISGSVNVLPEGVVFLPVTGSISSEMFAEDFMGHYWSSSADGGGNAYLVDFGDNSVAPNNSQYRGFASAVRLVTESSGGYAPAVKVTGVSLNKTKTTIEPGATKTLVATVAPANATNKQVNWSSSDTSVATVDANGNVRGVAIGSANIFATTADGNFDAVCLVTVKALPAGFVDLGLTSGFFWAEKNLGATNPQDYGKYFSWGDVTGQTPSGSTFSQAFGWNYDVFGQTFNKIAETTACPSGVLASTYDAAYQADNAWRMPTTEDFVELFKECYAEWGTYNGVSGLIVYKAKAGDAGYAYFNDKMNQYSGSGNSWTDATGKSKPSYSTSNDTFIFFPAAGLGYGQDFYYAGSVGYYWSSSLHASGEDVAFCLYFDSIEVTPQSYKYRYHGYSVRPVSN